MSADHFVQRIDRFFRLILSGHWEWFLHRLKLKLNPSFRHASAADLFRSQELKPVRPSFTEGVVDPLSTLKPVFFSHSLKREGAAISLSEIVLGFRERYALSPVVAAFEDGAMRRVYENHGIPVVVIPSRFDELTTQKRLDRLTKKIQSYMSKEGFNFVFANTLASFPSITAAHRSGIPSLWNIREGASGESFFRVLPEAVARGALSCAVLANKTVFVSKASRNQWQDYESLGKFEVIPNALKRDCFKKENFLDERQKVRNAFGLRGDSVVFLSVGSLEARKGQEDLIKAFDALPKDEQLKTEIMMTGDLSGAYARKMRKLALKCARPESIHFYDTLETIERCYAAADVFVLCSRSESYPRVILEAMAAGLPIITTPVDGVVEQVHEGLNAFFYKPFDFQALSTTMEQMAQDKTLVRMMGARSQEFYSSLPDFASMLERYAAAIRCIYSNQVSL